MSKDRNQFIRLRGVRQNNLKNLNLDLPLKKLIVITGLSGSGKSSLAFETLFAEGQRRYIETFSPYARQFLDRMDKPKVDSIEGIPPSIAIEQKNNVKSSRSTVGTMTEILEYAKNIWPHISTLYCRQCGKKVEKDAPEKIWHWLNQTQEPGSEILVCFDLPLSPQLGLGESIDLIRKQGFQRILLDGAIVDLNSTIPEAVLGPFITVVQDRFPAAKIPRPRFLEAVEQAYYFGKQRLKIFNRKPGLFAGLHGSFSLKHHCAACDLTYREPSPALFSFNHPLGACSKCRGFGRIVTIGYDLAIPDKSKTLAGGVIKPWQTRSGMESQTDLMKFCRKKGIPTNIPFSELPKESRQLVVEGEPGYGKDEAHQWPNLWYGLKGYFDYLESKTYKMHIRVLLSRYRTYVPCPDCRGTRFQPDSLLYKVSHPTKKGTTVSMADFLSLPVDQALDFLQEILGPGKSARIESMEFALQQVRSRLGYLRDAGLGYLTLDRATRTLSGGETERVNLTTCLGSKLVNTLFVLDEPSVGLHPRDTDRLVKILRNLQQAGNTVVVVEHDGAIMRAADEILDLGPGHGESGGELVFQGTFAKLLEDQASLTGAYLGGRRLQEKSRARKVLVRSGEVEGPALKIRQATKHNLENFSVSIPLQRFVCISGVSGSGKTTLVRDILVPHLQAAGGNSMEEKAEAEEESEASDAPSPVSIEGRDQIDGLIFVDQSPLGRTPRSNPAVYIGAFDYIRELFAGSEEARRLGLDSSAFSFNSPQGQCQRCRGAGFEKIEMQFLSDIFIRCSDCDGRRYRQHIMEVKITFSPGHQPVSIADILEKGAEEVVQIFSGMKTRKSIAAVRRLEWLIKIGLGYLKLGQPVNTLSGGEIQRLKLVRHLVEQPASFQGGKKGFLFVFDEPTTGLHFEDVHLLGRVFQDLVDQGHSLLVVEHNLQILQAADWIIDLGPEAGVNGGQIVCQGPPDKIRKCRESHTGKALRVADF